MRRLLPEGFLTIRQAAERLAAAMYGGVPDRMVIASLRELGGDVADGAALDGAVAAVWAAVDRGRVQALAIGPSGKAPLKLSADLSEAIPLLRSPRGSSLGFLRPGSPTFKLFADWFGPDLSNVSIVFRETEITRLARNRLRLRRRNEANVGRGRRGRPSRQVEIKATIREVIERKRWSPTQSLKALTQEVNRLGEWMDQVSEDTVQRALDNLYLETKDRQFERIHRQERHPARAGSSGLESFGREVIPRAHDEQTICFTSRWWILASAP